MYIGGPPVAGVADDIQRGLKKEDLSPSVYPGAPAGFPTINVNTPIGLFEVGLDTFLILKE
jgi:hypothetical protein